MLKIALALPLLVIVSTVFLPLGKDKSKLSNKARISEMHVNRALARLALKNEQLQNENSRLTGQLAERTPPAEARMQFVGTTEKVANLEKQLSKERQRAVDLQHRQSQKMLTQIEKMEAENRQLQEQLEILEGKNTVMEGGSQKMEQLQLRVLEMEKALAEAQKPLLPALSESASVVDTGSSHRIDAKPDVVSVARAALEGFLKAENLDQRLKYCISPASIEERAALYYRLHDAGPVETTSVIFVERAKILETNFHLCIFNVSTAESPEGFPVAMEETEQGMKVDWDTFIEFSTNRLATFVEQSSPESQETFHLIIERAHYFSKDLPNVDQKFAYQVYSPVNGSLPVHVFAPKSSELGSKLDEILNWNQTYMFIADLRWMEEEGSAPYLGLVRVRSFNWRGKK